jgi:hypothetical protein
MGRLVYWKDNRDPCQSLLQIVKFLVAAAEVEMKCLALKGGAGEKKADQKQTGHLTTW